MDSWQVLHVCSLDETQDPPVWVCPECSYRREVNGKRLDKGDQNAIHTGSHGGLTIASVEIKQNE